MRLILSPVPGIFLLFLLMAPAFAMEPAIRVIKDVAYGPEKLHTMDVYIPAQAEKAPVIFMVHGGGWRIGDKSHERVFENKVARWVPRGFIFISVNYRLLPTPVTDQAEDVAQALATAQQLASTWGGDPEKFITMGHSAGAHLVSLIGADPDRAYRHGGRPWLGTVSLDSAALNIVEIMSGPHLPLYEKAFGKDPSAWKPLSPYFALHAGARPWLGVCSTKRKIACVQTEAFAERMGALGVAAIVSKQALTHGEINETLGLPSSYTDNVEDFMAGLDKEVKKRLKD